jgi:hypothetical protein
MQPVSFVVGLQLLPKSSGFDTNDSVFPGIVGWFSIKDCDPNACLLKRIQVALQGGFDSEAQKRNHPRGSRKDATTENLTQLTSDCIGIKRLARLSFNREHVTPTQQFEP